MIAGYEPHRVAALGTRTRAALDSLARIVSDDPAADHAMTAVHRLRTTLETGLLPAVQAIEAADPLVRGARTSTLVGGLGGRLLHAIGDRFRAMSDDEIFAELVRLELDAPYDDDFQPDMDDPFWVPFAALAHELAARAEDDSFADLLVERSSDSFLIPMAVGFASFEPRVVGRMLVEVTRRPSAMVDLRSTYQARGAETLMSFLNRHPGEALAVLDESMLTELVAWPIIDQKTVGAFLSAAMEVPFRDPTQLTAAYGVLQHVVTLANRRAYEGGFPPELSSALTGIVARFVPFFITSLDGNGDVHLKDFAFQDVGVRLGSYPEVLDLFGALMRDRTSLDILLATVPGLAVIGAGDHGPLGIGPDDVADYVDTLGNAAENEQFEERIDADRSKRDVLLATEFAFGAIRIAAAMMGPTASDAVDAPLLLLERGTTNIVEWMTEATDLDLDDVRNIAFLLMVYGLGTGVLHNRRTDHDDGSRATRGAQPERIDRETIEQAGDVLERIEARLATGAPVENVEGMIDDFERLTRSLDHDQMMDILDDPRVRPPDIDVERSADTG